MAARLLDELAYINIATCALDVRGDAVRAHWRGRCAHGAAFRGRPVRRLRVLCKAPYPERAAARAVTHPVFKRRGVPRVDKAATSYSVGVRGI